MKINDEQYVTIYRAVSSRDTKERRARYLSGDFPRADLVKDIDCRYRWDLFWQAFSEDFSPEFKEQLRDYNDQHIDTALRRAVPELQ